MQSIFDPDRMPAFRALWAWIYEGWSEERVASMTRSLGLSGDIRHSQEARKELSLLLKEEGSIGGIEIWPGTYRPSHLDSDSDALIEAVSLSFVETWVRRRPSFGDEPQPLLDMMLMASVDPQGVEAAMLRTLSGGEKLGSVAFIHTIGDMAFQSQQSMSVWREMMLALGANPRDLALYLLGDLPKRPEPRGSYDTFPTAVGMLRSGILGYLVDTALRVELLFATGLFPSPRAAAEAVEVCMGNWSSSEMTYGSHQVDIDPYRRSDLTAKWLPWAEGPDADPFRDLALGVTAKPQEASL